MCRLRQTLFAAVFAAFFFLALFTGNGMAQDKPVLVHYMPWHTSKPVSGSWGFHWTMNHFDPDKVDENGKREIASHYYPLIGPYDSSDPHALQCHVQLMKLAGIDGVVIDWYGIEDHWDYGTIHKNAQLMVEQVKKAGLKFAVCYEDQTIDQLVQGDKVKSGSEVEHGTKVFKWLEENWFAEDAYVKLDGQPLLLIFGPLKFKKSDFETMTTGMKSKPKIFGLPHLSEQTNKNAYGWPPVTGGKEATKTEWTGYLDDLYGRAENGDTVIGAVFPQFHDIYDESGERKSYGSLDGQDGKTFEETMKRAFESKASAIQIATWNDFGEGTIIEPTKEFGYKYLEKLQTQIATERPDDLRLPVALYLARKKAKDNAEVLAKLDKVSDLIFEDKCDEARKALGNIP